MRTVFVDTSYLVAIIDSKDREHENALDLAKGLEATAAQLLTTDAVVIELGNYFARSLLRREAATWIETLRASDGWEIVPLERRLVLRAEQRYRRHVDKGWSSTDCISMEIMRARDVREIATMDRHFKQGGFRVLMR